MVERRAAREAACRSDYRSWRGFEMPFFNAISVGPSSVLTAIVVALLAVVALYLMRAPAHGAIISLARVLHAALRMASISVGKAQRLLAERNREVLLAAGREASEHIIEREFDRMDCRGSARFGRVPGAPAQDARAGIAHRGRSSAQHRRAALPAGLGECGRSGGQYPLKGRSDGRQYPRQDS